MGRDVRVPEENYPFSTKDGKAVPLDILKPKGFIYLNINNSAAVTFTIPNTSGVCFMYATADCVVQLEPDVGATPALPAFPAHNTLQNDMVFIPKGHMMTVAVNYGIARVIALSEAGYLTVQMITKWAGIDLETSYTAR